MAPFRAYAQGRGLATATLAMAWVLAQSNATMVPIPGTRNTAHLAELLAAEDLQLTAA